MEDRLPALFATLLFLTAVPGPSDLAVVSRSISSGFRQGLVMIAGIVFADALLITIAVLSLAGIVEIFAGVGPLLHYSCAGVLLWMGLRALLPKKAEQEPSPDLLTTSSFATGFLITLSEPKALLFYMALFPAYVDVHSVGFKEAITVLLLATVAIVSVKGLYAWLAARSITFLKNPQITVIMNRTAGLLFIALAVYIIVERS